MTGIDNLQQQSEGQHNVVIILNDATVEGIIQQKHQSSLGNHHSLPCPNSSPSSTEAVYVTSYDKEEMAPNSCNNNQEEIMEKEQEAIESLTVNQLIIELERMLSREAIVMQSDSFISNLLISTASPDLTVPVDALIHHPRFVNGSVTHDMLIEAANKSSILTVDTLTRCIMPEVKAKRATLILRDVEPRVTLRDVLELLSQHEKLTVNLSEDRKSPIDVIRCCGEIMSASSVANNWFLTFKDEELTQDVAWWLRSQTLGNTPVQVRIKSESTLRLDLLSHVNPTSYPPSVMGLSSELYRNHSYRQLSNNIKPPRSKGNHYRENRRGVGWKFSRQWPPVTCSYCQHTIKHGPLKAENEISKHQKTGEQSTENTTTTTAISLTPATSECTCHSNHQIVCNNQVSTYPRRSGEFGRHAKRHLKEKQADTGSRQSWRESVGGRKGMAVCAMIAMATTVSFSLSVGGRMHRGGRNGSSNGHHGNNSKAADKIVVVTQSDFPPLAEAVKNVGKVYGYMGKNFRQHSMRELQAICDNVPLESLKEPAAIAEALGSSNFNESSNCVSSMNNSCDGRGRTISLSLFESGGPRRHQWCYEALQKGSMNRNDQAMKKAKQTAVATVEGDTSTTSTDTDVVGTTPTRSAAALFWVTHRQNDKSISKLQLSTEKNHSVGGSENPQQPIPHQSPSVQLSSGRNIEVDLNVAVAKPVKAACWSRGSTLLEQPSSMTENGGQCN